MLYCKRDREKAMAYVGLFQFAQEIGDRKFLSYALECFGWFADHCADEQGKGEIARVRQWLTEAEAYEKQHGDGALLKRDHPFVISRAERVPPGSSPQPCLM
jgi:hypothetical protein